MPVNLDQINVRQAIDQTARGHLADATKVIRIDRVDLAARELFGAVRHGVEHLVVALQVVHRSKDEIQFVPMLFHPSPAGRRMHGVVIQLNPRANLYVRVRFAQAFDLVEVDSFMVAVVVGKGDVAQSARARRVHPGLQERARVRLHPMSLRVRVVIGEELHCRGVCAKRRVDRLGVWHKRLYIRARS